MESYVGVPINPMTVFKRSGWKLPGEEIVGVEVI
jgi:hypothetical protein